MKKLILIALLLPLFASAQITPAQDTTYIYTPPTSYAPQIKFANITLSGVNYRIPQTYNSLLGKIDSWVTTKYLRAFYAPLVGGGYVPYTGWTTNVNGGSFTLTSQTLGLQGFNTFSTPSYIAMPYGGDDSGGNAIPTPSSGVYAYSRGNNQFGWKGTNGYSASFFTQFFTGNNQFILPNLNGSTLGTINGNQTYTSAKMSPNVVYQTPVGTSGDSLAVKLSGGKLGAIPATALGGVYLNLPGSNANSDINIGNYGFSSAFNKIKDSVIVGGVGNGLIRINGAGSNDYGIEFGTSGGSIKSNTTRDSITFKVNNLRSFHLSQNGSFVADTVAYFGGIGTQGVYEGQDPILVTNGAIASYSNGNVMGGPGGNGPTPGRVLTIDGLNDASVNDGYSIGIDIHPHLRATADGQNLSAIWVDPDSGSGGSGFDLNGHTGVGTAGITNVQSLVEWSYIVHEGDFVGGQNAGITAGYGGCTNCGPSLGYNEHILGVGDTYNRSGQTWDVGGYGGTGTHFDGLVVHPTFMNTAPSGGYIMGRQQGIDLRVSSKSVASNTTDTVAAIHIYNSIKDANTTVNKQYGILIDELNTGTANYGIDNKASTLLEGAVTVTNPTSADNGSATFVSSDPAIRFKATGSVVADANTYEIRNLGASGNTYLQFRTINDANTVFSTKAQLWQSGGFRLGSTISDPGAGNFYAEGTITATAGVVTTGVTASIRNITSATTITTNDYTINVTSGTFSQPLPATPSVGQIFYIANSGLGVVTVTSSSAPSVINAGQTGRYQYTGTSGIYVFL